MTTDEISIDHLGAFPEIIPTLVAWLIAEWGHLFPHITPQMLVSSYQQRIVPGRIPQTFVALVADEVVGTASLVAHDLDARSELSPWLAAVYVRPDRRGKGVGSALVVR